mgnify:FL=1
MISRKAKFFVIMLVFPSSYNLPFCRLSAPLRLFNIPLLFFIDTSRSFMETIRCFTYPLRLSNEPTVYFIHRLRRFNVPMRLFNVPLGLFNVPFG